MKDFINAILHSYIQRRQKKKRNRNKTCEHSKNEHVFTPDISGYDSLVISRPEDNYQELNTVTADRWTITMSPLTIWHILFVLFVNMFAGTFTFENIFIFVSHAYTCAYTCMQDMSRMPWSIWKSIHFRRIAEYREIFTARYIFAPFTLVSGLI